MKSHRRLPMIEPLEPRIAPATFVNHATITYHDLDGDLVMVKLSKPLLADLTTANQIFHFDTGGVAASGTPDTTPQQLQLVDFTGFTGVASGVGMTATVKLAGNGEGFANVGRINATGIDLGGVAIKGDLGSITAGDNVFTTPGLKSLNVQSIGQFGTTTQAAGGTLVSNIAGTLGSLVVKSDVVGAFVSVAGDGTPAADTLAKIGIVTIGGSLTGTATDNSGQIRATGNIGPVKIGGDLAGGDGVNSGSIQSLGDIRSVTVGGSVLGGIGTSTTAHNTGGIIAHRNGPIKIYGDLNANSYRDSGKILGSIISVTIGGSLIGGDGVQGDTLDPHSSGFGQISFAGSVSIDGDVVGGVGVGGGAIGRAMNVKVKGSVHGGTGYYTGFIQSDGQVSVTSNVVGGGGVSSGVASADGSLSIGGSVVGGDGNGSGHASAVASLVIHGSVLGGDGGGSGTASSSSGTLSIHGSVIGSDGGSSGTAFSSLSLTIHGSVLGGDGGSSGTARSSSISLTIHGSVIGGAGEASGYILCPSGNTFIGGSLVGGIGRFSGLMLGSTTEGTVRILGSVIGGGGQASGYIDASPRNLSIGGSLIAGAGLNSGNLFGSVDHLTIGGSVVGTEDHHATISFGGNVTISGDVRFGEILGRRGSFVTNNLGAINIGGDFIASSIAAGVLPGSNGYGDGDTPDPEHGNALASIASITIGGQVLGTVGGTDHYGIVAERILSLSIGGNKIPLTPGAHNDTRPLGITGDLTIHEI